MFVSVPVPAVGAGVITLLLLLTGTGVSTSSELWIYNTIEFISAMKSKLDYSGTTVYLESDLDFSGGLSEQFEPKTSFAGIFDGQGHTISNLNVKPSSQYTGIFQQATGATFKNLVIDSSCSFTCNYVGSSQYIGSLVGYYLIDSSESSISGIVNMGSVIFEGTVTGSYAYLNLGGIVGRFYSSGFTINVRNSINYGNILHSGKTNSDAYIGGIVGQAYASLSKTIDIQNCLNYGVINVTGSSGALYIGGIVGYGTNISLINSLSAGLIKSSTTRTTGSVVGYVSPGNITHCLWTSGVDCDKLNGGGYPSISESTLVTINTTTVKSLNEYAAANGWNKWLLNTGNRTVTFKVNDYKGFDLSSQLIILPDIDPDKHDFDGWYSDSYCNEPFTSSKITSDTTLYGLYGVVVTVTFDGNGGTVAPIPKKAIVNVTYGELPEASRTGYKFVGWMNERNESVTSESIVRIPRNHTLIAHWTINNYTVTLDANGGTVTPTSKKVSYNEAYGELPEASRTGYTFTGWFTESVGGAKVEADARVTSDHTLYAHWTINNYTMTFDFGNGTVVEKQSEFNTLIPYPDRVEMTKEGYTFAGWDKDDEFVPASNLAITAIWQANEYTVTLDANGGDELAVKEVTVTFDSAYGAIPTPTKEGYTFTGWMNEKNESVTSESIVGIPRNHTLIAQWEEDVPAKQVEIVFGTKGMTEKEIKDIISHYTDEEFIFVKVEDDKVEDARVIIQFKEIEKAEEFIRNVNENKREEDSIKVVRAVNADNSLISSLFPQSLFISLLIF